MVQWKTPENYESHELGFCIHDNTRVDSCEIIHHNKNMPKIDRIKEELSWLKIVFSVFIAIDVSLVAWLARNYDKTSGVLIIFGFIAVVVFTSVVVWVNRAAMRRFKELEEE